MMGLWLASTGRCSINCHRAPSTSCVDGICHLMYWNRPRTDGGGGVLVRRCTVIFFGRCACFLPSIFCMPSIFWCPVFFVYPVFFVWPQSCAVIFFGLCACFSKIQYLLYARYFLDARYFLYTRYFLYARYFLSIIFFCWLRTQKNSRSVFS